MTETTKHTLGITRLLSASRHHVWRCWTEEKLLKEWFCPRPWTVTKAHLEMRPGGRMDTVFAGPDGERLENVGCFLEVLPEERLVFTDAFAADFMPRAEPFVTCVVDLSEESGGRTKMVWGARHATAEARQKHLDMGFDEGWNAAAAQLDTLAQALAANTEA